MICLTRRDGTPLFLNSDLVESVESTPDTVIRLTNQKCLLVKEPASVVVARMLRIRRLVGSRRPPCANKRAEQ